MKNIFLEEYEKILMPYMEYKENKENKRKKEKPSSPEYACDLCGYRWKTKTRPIICVHCKSHNWNLLEELRNKYGYFYEKLSNEDLSKLKEKYGWLIWKEIKLSKNPYSRLKSTREVLELNEKELRELSEQMKDLIYFIQHGKADIELLQKEIDALSRGGRSKDNARQEKSRLDRKG